MQEANVPPPPLLHTLGVCHGCKIIRIETLDITEEGGGCVYAGRRGEWKRVPLRDPAIEIPIHSTRTPWLRSVWDFCD